MLRQLCCVQGFSHSMQISGLGPLAPNTILMSWPRHTSETNWRKFPEKAAQFCSLIREATAMEKAVVLMKGKTHFPAPDEIQDQGYIDIWWIIHDGGLLLLIAHLLQVCVYESWCDTSAPNIVSVCHTHALSHSCSLQASDWATWSSV